MSSASPSTGPYTCSAGVGAEPARGLERFRRRTVGDDALTERDGAGRGRDPALDRGDDGRLNGGDAPRLADHRSTACVPPAGRGSATNASH